MPNDIESLKARLLETARKVEQLTKERDEWRVAKQEETDVIRRICEAAGTRRADHDIFDHVTDLRTRALAAEAREAKAVETLRAIAEGNLGDGPGQANYARIKQVALASLPKESADA